MVPSKPKLVFHATVRRRPLLRRFGLWLLLSLAAGGAYFGVDETYRRGLIDGQLHLIGAAAALLLIVLSALNAALALAAFLTRRDEVLRFFDQGFGWKRGSEEYKASWAKVESLRETNAAGIYAGKRPLLQWGVHTLKMRDGKVFRFTPAHGDMRRFLRAIRPYVADVTGTRMGQTLRDEDPYPITRGLTLYPGGIQAGRHEIPWTELDARIEGNRLSIYRLNKNGKFRRVQMYDSRRIDNLSGFMEVVTSTMRNYQPERFGIKTQGPLAQMLAKKTGQKIDIRVAPRLLDNVLYRSKLEYEFAVQLRERRIRWQYESEPLGRKQTLIDFYLPDLGVWVDVMRQKPDGRTEAILSDIYEYLWLQRNQQRLFVYLPDGALYIGSQGPKPLSHNEFWIRIFKP